MIHMSTYNELIASSLSFNRLLDNIHQQDQEHSTDIPYRRSSTSRTISEKETEEDMLFEIDNTETKEEGLVNWRVYISYLRAGAGLILGIFLVTFVFGIREIANVYYSWWLAKWTDDEGYRHSSFNNCTNLNNPKMKLIKSMNDTQWNNYRNERFYYYCGLQIIIFLFA